MIDFEAEVFSTVESALTSAYPGISVESVENYSPSVFPSVSIVEIGNGAYELTQDSGSMENHATVSYEINVHSNRASGRKKECKEIAAVIDNVMAGLGFTRLTATPVVLDDASRYRLAMRYSAVISKTGVIYRR